MAQLHFARQPKTTTGIDRVACLHFPCQPSYRSSVLLERHGATEIRIAWELDQQVHSFSGISCGTVTN